MGLFHASGLDEECNKAAKVLKNFVDKKKIPPEALANAKGLAIFSGFRGGAMWVGGAGGSGIVVARLEDGTWSPPSAFSVVSGSVGMVYGLDMYDCVCVLNTQAAVDAYAHTEVDLGMVAAVGPASKGLHVNPVVTYTRARGLYGGVTVEGTVIKEKKEINAGAFGQGVSGVRILKGEAPLRREGGEEFVGLRRLMEIVKAGEGKAADGKVIEQVEGTTPGDAVAE